MAVLSQLLKGSRKSLTQVCLRWYHQYCYFRDARETIQTHFAKAFKLSGDFVDIVQGYGLVAKSQGDAVIK